VFTAAIHSLALSHVIVPFALMPDTPNVLVPAGLASAI
jgi:hypothetical protein